MNNNNNNNRKQVVNRLKPLCSNQKQWDSFCDYLDILIVEQHKKLEQSEDIISLHRAQGAVQMLNRLKLLRDEALADG
jgi:hypothetical protein